MEPKQLESIATISQDLEEVLSQLEESINQSSMENLMICHYHELGINCELKNNYKEVTNSNYRASKVLILLSFFVAFM